MYPDLVDDQQRDSLQAIELAIEPALALGVREQRDPFGRGSERDALGGPSRTTFFLAARKSSWPRCKTALRGTEV
jgi:hypothetical protein